MKLNVATATKKVGSTVCLAVDTQGNLLAAHVTSAGQQERSLGGVLAAAVQECTGENVRVAFTDQGYTVEKTAGVDAVHGIRREVLKHTLATPTDLPLRWEETVSP